MRNAIVSVGLTSMTTEVGAKPTTVDQKDGVADKVVNGL